MAGAIYGGVGGIQLAKQVGGAMFVIGWNLVVTSIIMVLIQLVCPLRMTPELLVVGDDAAHGEEAYALWGDGEKYDMSRHGVNNEQAFVDTGIFHGLNVGERGPTVSL